MFRMLAVSLSCVLLIFATMHQWPAGSSNSQDGKTEVLLPSFTELEQLLAMPPQLSGVPASREEPADLESEETIAWLQTAHTEPSDSEQERLAAGSETDHHLRMTGTIENLKPQTEILTAVARVTGTCQGNLPLNHSLWVVGEDAAGVYYVMWPMPKLNPNTGKWVFGNLRLGSVGLWTIHLVHADKKANRGLLKRVAADDWSGLLALPQGSDSLAQVPVVRLRSSFQHN